MKELDYKMNHSLQDLISEYEQCRTLAMTYDSVKNGDAETRALADYYENKMGMYKAALVLVDKSKRHEELRRRLDAMPGIAGGAT